MRKSLNAGYRSAITWQRVTRKVEKIDNLKKLYHHFLRCKDNLIMQVERSGKLIQRAYK